jgi:lysophospholipid acyltransferase (LPLAT)-like uncharacterized protein
MSRSRPRLLRRLRRSDRFAAFEVRFAARLVWLLMLFLRLTTRVRVVGVDLPARWKAVQGGAEHQPVILAFWHGRGIMLPFFYSGPGATIMNSEHRDGEIVTRALGFFGIQATRGSDSRGGVGGLLGLMRAGRKGRDLALIPDGPRGPAAQAKAGVAELALTMGVPVIPVAFSATSFARLTSWDRMMIPMPGAEIVVVVGEPLIPGERKRGEEGKKVREELRERIQQQLVSVTRQADREAGREEEDS